MEFIVEKLKLMGESNIALSCSTRIWQARRRLAAVVPLAHEVNTFYKI